MSDELVESKKFVKSKFYKMKGENFIFLCVNLSNWYNFEDK